MFIQRKMNVSRRKKNKNDTEDEMKSYLYSEKKKNINQIERKVICKQ